MERRVDENEEIKSEEEEVPATSTCSERNENSGTSDATTCSSRIRNQGVILRNDDSGRDESFLSSRSRVRGHAKPPSSSTPLVAHDADSSAVSNVEENLGIGMLALERYQLCDAEMLESYNENTLSTIESPAYEPGLLSFHLFEPASLQLLPEAQLNLPMDNKNPPNFADCSNPGGSTSSDSSSQLLRETQDSNSLVVSDDQFRLLPTSSTASADGCRSDQSSQLLTQTQDSNSLEVSDDQLRLFPKSFIDSAVECLSDQSSQLLTQTQDSNSLVISDDQLRCRTSSSTASADGCPIDPSSQLLTQTQRRLVVSDDQPTRHRPRSSSAVRCPSKPSSQLLTQTQGRIVVSDDQPRYRPRSSSAVRCPSKPSSQLLTQTQGRIVVSDDQPTRYRPRSSSAVRRLSEPSSQLLQQTESIKPLMVSRGQSRQHHPTNTTASAARNPSEIPDSRPNDETNHFHLHVGSNNLGVYFRTSCKCKTVCPKLGNLYSYLNIRSAKKSFKCEMPECNRIFRNISEFTSHVNLHCGESPYICCECGKRFDRSEDLDAHMATHASD